MKLLKEIIEDIVGDMESYLLGNIIKYISRYKHKNGVQDLRKAKWYLDKLIEIDKGNATDCRFIKR